LRGYRESPEAPPPAPGTWGDHPPLPSVVAQAAVERQSGGAMRDAIRVLDIDPTDALAVALPFERRIVPVQIFSAV
jgi:hypothetical protein